MLALKVIEKLEKSNCYFYVKEVADIYING